jgi:DNA-binding transcriptional regulator PaaX
MLDSATNKMNSTRTLIFGIFVLAGRKLTAPQVIALAEPVGVSASNLKSHLTRMVNEETLRRSGPARRAVYWPSQSHSKIIDGINARLNESRTVPWDHTWLILMLQMPSNRRQREILRASLWFDGFRPFAPNTFVRPAWPKNWALQKTREYLAITRGASLRGNFINKIEMSNAIASYDLNVLNREATRLATWINTRQIPSHARNSAAFALRLKVGGLVARLIGHDPRLPPVIWHDRSGMSKLVGAFRNFEKRIAPLSQNFLDEVIRTTER